MKGTNAVQVGVELTGQQRVRLRRLLETTWRAQVGQITELSLRLHSDPPERALIDELAAAHHALREIEAALGRLETGGYGVCEACGSAIPWERLEALPQGRCCARCT
ncbi:MAG: TraR/DksA C4-type zinc finger protein [Frankiaceae bacterium]